MEAAEKSGKKFSWKREIYKFFLGLIKDYVKNFINNSLLKIWKLRKN